MQVGSCPSCGAPVEFRPGAGKVKVCEHCRAVVLRGEAGLERLGKVAELVDTESPLRLGLRGRDSGTAFTVAGRIQKSNGAGTWDEWYLTYEDESDGWLAESEGEWKLLRPLSEGIALPDPSTLAPLQRFDLRGTSFVVEEVNGAHTVSAEGELPSFEKDHRYVDATGPRGVFCSLEATEGKAEGYVGRVLPLSALGFDPAELSPTPRRDALTAALCTQCRGPLELKAPDASKRVACPWCGALLSVEHGTLSFLALLEKPPQAPAIPLGRVGHLADPTEPGPACDWVCLAFLVRSCEVEGQRYAWEEYLLWNAKRGFRWLMQANGHWTWLRPIAAGEVKLGFKRASFGQVNLRAFQTVYARTDFVLGECYWAVEVGELAKATEYVAPPLSLNVDQTPTEATLTWCTLVEARVLQQAFSLEAPLPAPVGLAPASVNPYRQKAVDAVKWAGVWAAAMVALMIVFAALGTTQTYFHGDFEVPPGGASGSPEVQRFSDVFTIAQSVPLEVTVKADTLANDWLGVSVDLVNQDSGEVVNLYAEPSLYSGVDDGESWSEGNTTVSKQADVVEKGRYLVRVTPSFEPGHPRAYSVTVAADDGAGFVCPFSLLLLLALGPAYFLIRSSSFESTKWNDSVFQTGPGVGS